ncbi:hypothetical protein [Streptosporangium sp. NPDC087985]|uniref:hypothetical protein n=1 Tax=Streptosporangium sp. NPDC087985 TaxID=3366196 RepID=UPI003815AD77
MHVRLVSFALIFIFAIGLMAFLIGLTWLVVLIRVLAVVAVGDLILVIRRRPRLERDQSDSV